MPNTTTTNPHVSVRGRAHTFIIILHAPTIPLRRGPPADIISLCGGVLMCCFFLCFNSIFVCVFFCSIFLQFTLCFRASATGESVYAVLQCRCDSARSEIEWCALESTYRIVGGGSRPMEGTMWRSLATTIGFAGDAFNVTILIAPGFSTTHHKHNSPRGWKYVQCDRTW